MTGEEITYTVLGSSVLGGIVVAIISKIFGMKKEDAEIVLNYEKINDARELKMLREIKRLEDKVQKLINKLTEKDLNLKKWESYCEQLKSSAESERGRNTKLDQINEKLEEEIRILKAKF